MSYCLGLTIVSNFIQKIVRYLKKILTQYYLFLRLNNHNNHIYSFIHSTRYAGHSVIYDLVRQLRHRQSKIGKRFSFAIFLYYINLHVYHEQALFTRNLMDLIASRETKDVPDCAIQVSSYQGGVIAKKKEKSQEFYRIHHKSLL